MLHELLPQAWRTRQALQTHAHGLTRSLGGPPLSGNGVQPIVDAQAAQDALLTALEQAQDHVQVGGDWGAVVMQRLAWLRNHGLAVNHLPERLQRWSLQREARLLIDGRWAFMGVGSEGLLRIAGPVVGLLQRAFMADWLREADLPMRAGRPFPGLHVAGSQRAAIAGCEPHFSGSRYQSALLTAIATAQSQVRLSGVGWGLSPALRQVLRDAQRRGVDVRCLRSTGHEAPLAVIDGVWASMGGGLLDWRSALHDAHTHLIVLDEGFASRVLERFEHQAALGAPLVCLRT